MTVSYGVVTATKISLLSTAVEAVTVSGAEKGFISQFAYEISKHRNFERELQGLNTRVAF